MAPSRNHAVNSLRFHLRRLTRNEGALLVLVLLLSSGAWAPLLHPGFLSTRAGGDSPFLLIRLDQLLRNLHAGVFPARWMPDASYGLGYPFFNYYAALPYYVAAGLALCGWGLIAALKITQALGFLASGVAMYVLGRHIFRSPTSALLAAVAYVYAPFHLVNVYVRGDSLSEFYAFIWYPLLGCVLLRLRTHASVGDVLLLGGVYGGLIVTHNISALIATPLTAAYALLLLFTGEGHSCSRLRFLLMGLAGGLLGLGLSGWFWLPALLERDWVQLQEMTTGYFHFAGHFRGMDLVQPRWIFDYTIGEHRDPFSMGLMQASWVGLSLLILVGGWIRRRNIGSQSAFALGAFLLVTLCITPLSRPLWEHVPLLALVQFPWRFLSLQAFFSSVLMGVMVERLTGTRVVAAGVALCLMVSALGGLHPEWMAIGEEDVTSGRLRLYEYFTANIGTTVRAEYLPRWVETRPFTSAVFLHQGQKPAPMVIEGDVDEAHPVNMSPIRELWDITVASREAVLAFYTHYFPGWEARVDGRPHPLFPVEGWGTIGLRLPQGRHEVILYLGRTRVRWIGELISSLTLALSLTLLVLSLRGWRRRARAPRLLIMAGLVVAVLVLGVAGGTLRGRTRYAPAPEDLSGDLSMDFVRQPYLHHNPEGVRFRDGVRLLRYQFSSDTVRAGGSITVTLTWQAVVGGPLTATVRLDAPSKPVFGESPLDAIYPGHIVAQSLVTGTCQTMHSVEVPVTAVPGPYLLAVELRDGREVLPSLTPQGRRLGTTYLPPIWVSAPGHEGPTQRVFMRVPPREPLAYFGERIALLAVETERREAKRLYIRFAWKALRPIPANYNLSLRLRDPSSDQIAVRDLQPHYGFYPTNLWPPGAVVEDILSVPIPEDMPPGDSYTLEVILYPVATLAPVGQAEVGMQIGW